MIAYLFVYTSSTFQVGAHELKRFVPGVHFDKADTAIPADTAGIADPGIYIVLSDNPEEDPTPQSDQERTVDYDVYLVAGKDPWPWIVGPGDSLASKAVSADVDPELSTRVLASFPNLTDAQLAAAVTERG